MWSFWILNQAVRTVIIFNYIKALKLSWCGAVYQMTNDRLVKKLYEWNPIYTRPAERPKTGWENDIKVDLWTVKINNWTKHIQDRVKWKEVVEKVKTFKTVKL